MVMMGMVDTWVYYIYIYIPRPPKVKKIMYDWDFCIVGTIGTLELKTSLSQEDLNALIWIHPLCLTLFFFVTVLTPTDLQP